MALHLKKTELPLPKDALIYTKFGVNWLCYSGELEDKNVKRTDREQAIRKSHLSFQVRGDKNKRYTSLT